MKIKLTYFVLKFQNCECVCARVWGEGGCEMWWVCPDCSTCWQILRAGPPPTGVVSIGCTVGGSGDHLRPALKHRESSPASNGSQVLVIPTVFGDPPSPVFLFSSSEWLLIIWSNLYLHLSLQNPCPLEFSFSHIVPRAIMSLWSIWLDLLLCWAVEIQLRSLLKHEGAGPKGDLKQNGRKTQQQAPAWPYYYTHSSATRCLFDGVEFVR